ncbi:hypothetical protein SAMN06297358_1276 [Pedobacter xixiisoli]|uniref:Uncharacterized protein n=1 Tax=Pedobacter xixiisoli TaxID=1476464 RepID=A0A285ZW32_9SPHI|nr:hypothetical protein SAMN06297358_1276 [Pedobacter xixiisoli]
MLKKGYRPQVRNGNVLLAIAILWSICFVQFAELAHQFHHAAEHSHHYSGENVGKDTKCDVCSYYQFVHSQHLLLDKGQVQWSAWLNVSAFCFLDQVVGVLDVTICLTTNRGPPKNIA